MPSVADVLDVIERIAPKRAAFEWDKVGLQVGDPASKVARGIVSLDWSEGLCDAVEKHRAQVVVAHHPLIWDPVQTITSTDSRGRVLQRLMKAGTAYIACHTNWDAAPGGVNDTLAAKLNLKDVAPFGEAAGSNTLKLVTFCPKESLQAIIDALSAAGAGVIGLYERCAFYSPGTGTYMGGEGSTPIVGKAGKVEETPEVRLEMRLPVDREEDVISALRKVHPYEEPAFDLFPLRPSSEFPIGRIGSVRTPVSLAEFVSGIDKSLKTKCVAWGKPQSKIKRVAVVGGAADDEWKSAKDAGADVLVTGEVKQHNAVAASHEDFSMIAAGHFATEHPGCAALRDRLEKELPEISWVLYEPAEGEFGRPI